MLADTGSDVGRQLSRALGNGVLKQYAELGVVVEVRRERATFEHGAAREGKVLAGLQANHIDLVVHRLVGGDRTGRVGECMRGDGARHCPKLLVARGEVGLRADLDDRSLAVAHGKDNASLASGAVGARVHLALHLLADDLLSRLHVTVGLDERVLALAHAQTGAVTELHHVLGADVYSRHMSVLKFQCCVR